MPGDIQRLPVGPAFESRSGRFASAQVSGLLAGVWIMVRMPPGASVPVACPILRRVLACLLA
jgi:hypothetical protein